MFDFTVFEQQNLANSLFVETPELENSGSRNSRKRILVLKILENPSYPDTRLIAHTGTGRPTHTSFSSNRKRVLLGVREQRLAELCMDPRFPSDRLRPRLPDKKN